MGGGHSAPKTSGSLMAGEAGMCSMQAPPASSNDTVNTCQPIANYMLRGDDVSALAGASVNATYMNNWVKDQCSKKTAKDCGTAPATSLQCSFFPVGSVADSKPWVCTAISPLA
jgi:hypothetical protein